MLTWYEQGLLIGSLMLLMLGVGASLETQAFQRLKEHPKRLVLDFSAVWVDAFTRLHLE